MSKSVSRRRFLKSTSTLGALGAFASCWATDWTAQAEAFQAKNDRPLVGAIGVGGRGMGITKEAARFGDVVAVCDADLQRAESAKATLGGKAAVFQDYRKMIEAHPEIEVIINGTPEHWHTAINIAALRAGKDLYTEKPLTLTIEEGQILCRVARETKRIVQVGTQQRSVPHYRTTCELVRNGRIGKLRQVAVLLPLYPAKGGPFATKPAPPKVNWDLFQGQAPERPFCPERLHFSWRFWSEYGGGKICDWGQHEIDIAHWGMGMEHTGPMEIEGKAFFPNHGKPDCYSNADRFVVKMKYPNDIEMLAMIVHDKKYMKTLADGDMTEAEDRELFSDVPEEWRKEQRNGVMFIGDQGRVFVNRAKAHGKAIEELAQNPLPSDALRLYESKDHMGNFFECVKTRKQTISPVDVGHRVITACHLGNIAIHLKRKIRWDAQKEEIVGDTEAANSVYVRREQRKPYTCPV